MDVSRIRKKNLKVWVPLEEDEAEAIFCRHISQSEFDAIVEEATDQKGRRDEKKFRSLLGRLAVEGWRGITDEDVDFPFTPENIDYLMEESTSFRLKVMDAPLSMQKMLALEQEQKRKNLLDTSRDVSITPTSTASSAEKTSESME